MIDVSTLNEEQKSAVLSDADKILCLAGAGTGKTQCMMYRMLHLVEDKEVDPSHILALTFTNAAALEMKERYKRISGKLTSIAFYTFHAFCYSILCTNKQVRTKLGYINIPEIADDYDTRTIENTAQLQSNVKLSLPRLKHPETLTIKQQSDYQMYKYFLRRLYIKRNLISFDMLADSITQLFIDNDESVSSYLSQYEYIFVDEFQDTDPLQFKFVESFINAKKFVIGDALQSIYGFRNADSTIIKKLASSENWTTYKLYQNYRSSRQICDFANTFSKTYADDKYRIEIQSDKEGPDIELKECRSRMVFRMLDDNTVTHILEDASKPGCTAILCRTNSLVDFLRRESQGKFIDRAGIIQEHLLHINCILSEEFYMNHLASLLSNRVYMQYLYSKLLKQYYTLNTFINQFIDRDPAILEFVSEHRKYEAVCESFNPVKLATHFHIDEIIDTESLYSTRTLYKYAEVLSAIPLNKDSLYIGTIHSSKGLEYDNVILVDVGGPSFRLYDEELKNLYYVGITRAKSHLIIYKGV